MEQRGLKQSGLVPVLGSRSQVSDLVNGKRGIGQAQIKKLAACFRVSPELFILR
jgi:HTH-type transcriptional regulator/antitoxin HigA